MPDRTLIIAATNLLTRGFLVVPTDRLSRTGQPVNALFAVARAITKALVFKTPAHVIAVVEGGGALPVFSGAEGSRASIEAAPETAAWPAILLAQLPRLRELLTTLGCQVVDGDQQVVAAYARAAIDAGGDVMIVGVDKRYAQLVTDRLWWFDPAKDVRYTPEIVTKRFGVPPDKLAGWLGLVGDDDALPGVKGIGAKGATTLVATYGSIDAAVAAAPTMEGRLGKALRAAAAEVPVELARATLNGAREVTAARPFVAPSIEPVNALLDELGFVELLSAEATTARAVTRCESPAQVAEVIGRLGSEPAAMHALLEDDETLFGIALTRGDGAAWFVPVASDGWDGLTRWLADPAALKLGHDLLPTTLALRRLGVELAGVVGDSAHASHLTQPSGWAPHDLVTVAKHVLGRALPDPDATRGSGQHRKPWAALPPARATELAADYADAALAIWRALAPAIDPARLAEYAELTTTCVRMEVAGLTIDVGALDEAERAFAAIEVDLTAQVEALAGHSFNINSGKQLGVVLFDELKLPIVSHTKTGYSTAIEALERIGHAHPILPLVIRWRLLRRMRDSWIVALRRCITADGRVHSRSHPARSFSGQLVNTNPDLARVPGRTIEMQMIRRAFVAAPDHVLMAVDFNQLGLHVLAHLSGDPALVEPLRARADLHAITAAAVLDKPLADITADERQLGKVVNFATFAGQGPSALALQLGVSAAEAKAMTARFDARYAGVRAFQDEQLRLVHERGYLITIAGRHWPVGGLGSLDSHDRSYAERLARRGTHEGSVADVVRRALLGADQGIRAAGLRAVPLVSITDEVLFEVPKAELAMVIPIVTRAMCHAFELAVPLVVGVELGPNWADMTPLVDYSG